MNNWLKVGLSAGCSKCECSEFTGRAKRLRGRLVIAAAHESTHWNRKARGVLPVGSFDFDLGLFVTVKLPYRTLLFSIRVLQYDCWRTSGPCYHTDDTVFPNRLTGFKLLLLSGTVVGIPCASTGSRNRKERLRRPGSRISPYKPRCVSRSHPIKRKLDCALVLVALL